MLTCRGDERDGKNFFFIPLSQKRTEGSCGRGRRKRRASTTQTGGLGFSIFLLRERSYCANRHSNYTHPFAHHEYHGVFTSGRDKLTRPLPQSLSTSARGAGLKNIPLAGKN